MSNTFDYLVAPKASFDATADAIRAINGTNSSITWGQDGFASAIGNGRRYDIDTIAVGNFSPNLVITANTIRKGAFMNVPSLLSVEADNVTDLSGGAAFYTFSSCTNLQSLHMANLTTIANGERFCQGCTSLTSIYLPKIRDLGNYAFQGCTSLTTVVLQDCVGSYQSFVGCTGLEAIDYGGNYETTSSLNANNFNGCTKLETIILRKSISITPLNNVNVFTNTPFANGKAGGTIYIPKALYDHLGDGTSLDYQSATNWSTIYGYGTITWAKIEGSYYETNYADGTTIGGTS